MKCTSKCFYKQSASGIKHNFCFGTPQRQRDIFRVSKYKAYFGVFYFLAANDKKINPTRDLEATEIYIEYSNERIKFLLDNDQDYVRYPVRKKSNLQGKFKIKVALHQARQ